MLLSLNGLSKFGLRLSIPSASHLLAGSNQFDFRRSVAVTGQSAHHRRLIVHRRGQLLQLSGGRRPTRGFLTQLYADKARGKGQFGRHFCQKIAAKVFALKVSSFF